MKSASSGVVWAGASQAGRVLLQLATLMALSRLLPPADFGLIAMATVVTTFAMLFRDMGTSAAVVQREHLSEDLLDTVFWMNTGLGVAFAIVILVFAVPLQVAFREPELGNVLIALAVTFPIASTAIVHQGLLERNLGFRTLARIELSSGAVALALAVTGAAHGLGVYSLVLNTIANVTLTTLQLWLASKWRPHWRWSAAEARSLFGFSGNLVSFQVLNYFARNADTFLIGRFLGAVDLGWYNTAYRIMLFPLSNLSGVLIRSLLPVLSRLQNDVAAFGRLYLRTISAIALITAPLMAGLWVVRDPLVEVMLGRNWLPAADVIAWLAPVGFVQAVSTTLGLIYIATGNTRLMMRWGFYATLIAVGAIALGLRWGYVGVAAAYAIANLALLYPASVIPLRLIGLKFSDMVRSVGRQLFAAIVMAACLYCIDRFLLAASTAWEKLLILVPLGACIYALLAWMLLRAAVLNVATVFTSRTREGSVQAA